MLRAHTHATDVVTRLGGDEFFGLLRRPDHDSVIATAEMLRRCIGEISLDLPGAHGQPIALSASVGTALFQPGMTSAAMF